MAQTGTHPHLSLHVLNFLLFEERGKVICESFEATEDFSYPLVTKILFALDFFESELNICLIESPSRK